MIGVIIGSGIFRTPPDIAKNLGSPGLILAFWLLGGLLCLAGALTYAELGSMYPHSGGVYVFIREAFGPCPAFVFGWSYMLLAKPFAAAGIAFVFAEHLNLLLGTQWDPRVATTVMLAVLTAINIRGVRLSTGFAGVLTGLKFAALLGMVTLALILRKGDAANFAATPAPRPLLDAAGPVMFAILWTYDGWADVGAISGEVENPQRRLPLIYCAGTAAIIALYLSVNAVYLWLMPLSEMRESETVAPQVMKTLVGPSGLLIVAAIVIVSTAGSSHASIMTGARVSYAQARDGLLFRFIGHVHPRWHTPDVALTVQLLLSCLALWVLGSFQRLADGFVFTMWIFYALGGAAVFVLRWRRPHEIRPFRCPGYPIVPGVFILAAAAMTVLSLRDETVLKACWLVALAAGVPVYYLWRAWSGRGGGTTTG